MVNGSATQSLQTPNNTNNQEMSNYEKCREERIKENLERMQKLGIYDLSLKLKSVKPNTNRYPKNNNNYQKKAPVSPLPSSVPTRRSSRLQSTPAVSYAEVVESKKGKDGHERLMGENSRPEVYTDEHEKKLGEAKTEWTLFVDGHGKDGKRIYDPVRGKTCHQCRQKTLGHRTHCIQCNMVQGQFCGDCLYMRYGENVLETKQNPDWICPVCRGICNCSLCRQGKGWAATGVMYRKITSLGYKSVAHYLIQTRRADPNSETNEEIEAPVCVKKSLLFSNEDSVVKTEKIEKSKQADVILERDQEMKEKNPKTQVDEGEDENKNEVNESEAVESEAGVKQNEKFEDLKHKLLVTDVDSEDGISKNNEVKLERNQGTKDKNPEPQVDECELQLELINPECKDNNKNDEVNTNSVIPKTKPVSRKKRCAVIVLENSIAGRLRSRRKCT